TDSDGRDVLGERLRVVEHDVVSGVRDGDDPDADGFQLRRTCRRLRERPDEERARDRQLRQQGRNVFFEAERRRSRCPASAAGGSGQAGW
ncbi:hypothetical protein, partial [Streptomyces tanashiensis]|uniref:hypothetical protein n=1 Tax=Streptomyces tanashiensis TaxID=67367 RepID=UPI003F4D114C